MKTLTTDKTEALATFLECDASDITQSYGPCEFEAQGQEFLVLTEDEAYERANQYIEDTLWAFNPRFLTPFMHGLTSLSDKDFEEFHDTLKGMQERMCESCNPIIRLMIRENLQKLISEAISSDGIAHFLNTYDGKEHEQGDFFIYRVN